MDLRLYDTLTKEKRRFVPLDPENVRMYVCGPTVYDFAHIGNARPVIVFDVLFRLLRHVYGKSHVKYARNITDVDDKINTPAAERGLAIRELTEGTYADFHQDGARLGVPRRHQRARTSGLAHRMLRDELEASRRDLRHPWRRHRSGVSASRERDRAVALRLPHARDGECLDAQRLPAGRKREDVEV